MTTSCAPFFSAIASALAPFSVRPRTITYGAEMTTLLVPPLMVEPPGAAWYST